MYVSRCEQHTFLIGLFNLHAFFPMPITDWESTAHFDSLYGNNKNISWQNGRNEKSNGGWGILQVYF